jgi:hypothetical protein
MKYEISVTFCIASFEFDPNEITAKTGVIPTHIARIGEPVSAAAIKPSIKAKIKDNRWEVKSELAPSAELEAHLRSLIKRLQPGWSALVELGTQYGAMFTCVVWDYNDERPAIYFDRSIIKCATELNAGIEVIVYG